MAKTKYQWDENALSCERQLIKVSKVNLTIFSGKTLKGMGRIHEYFTSNFGRAEDTMKFVLNAKSDHELAKHLLDTYVFLLVILTSPSDVSSCFVVSDSGLQVNMVSYRLHFLKLEVLVTSTIGRMLNFSQFNWCLYHCMTVTVISQANDNITSIITSPFLNIEY